MINPWASKPPTLDIDGDDVDNDEGFSLERIYSDEEAARRQREYARGPQVQPDFTEQQSKDMLDQSKNEAPAHVVVLSFQEENWGDDGGDHCPLTRKLTPTQLAWLDGITGVVDGDDPMLVEIRYNLPDVALPANVERVETLWTRGYC